MNNNFKYQAQRFYLFENGNIILNSKFQLQEVELKSYRDY